MGGGRWGEYEQKCTLQKLTSRTSTFPRVSAITGKRHSLENRQIRVRYQSVFHRCAKEKAEILQQVKSLWEGKLGLASYAVTSCGRDAMLHSPVVAVWDEQNIFICTFILFCFFLSLKAHSVRKRSLEVRITNHETAAKP